VLNGKGAARTKSSSFSVPEPRLSPLSSPGALHNRPLHLRHTSSNTSNGHSGSPLLLSQLGSHLDERDSNDGDSPSGGILTEFLVLDFSAVLGVDATAARSCFLMLIQLMKIAQVVVVFANMSPTIERLLRSHNVIQQRADHVVIPQLDDALEWCEEQVLFR